MKESPPSASRSASISTFVVAFDLICLCICVNERCGVYIVEEARQFNPLHVLDTQISGTRQHTRIYVYPHKHIHINQSNVPLSYLARHRHHRVGHAREARHPGFSPVCVVVVGWCGWYVSGAVCRMQILLDRLIV